ncbi:retrovirus-related pol polyprotein from transposon TNT 1-94 [Tanacetum coccineum]
MIESPLVESGFAVLVFSPGDNPIACLNKATAFLTVVASSRFPSTNNQLRTSLNPRNHDTIQDGRVTVQQVHGRQGLLNATTVKVKDIWLGNALSLRDQGMQHDPGVSHYQVVQKIIPNNAAFQTEDLDTYDSDCDDISNAKPVLMANISNYGSDVISEVVHIVLWFLDFGFAFRKNTCFIRNLEGVDLLSGSRDTNLYTISLDDMLKTSLICLLSKASKTKSWLWHRRLSHLNFGTLKKLAKDGLARGIPRLKFQKDHLCSACALGKSKKSSHQPKAEDTNQEKLYILHMDLYGPIRVASINKKRYILVIVDDYSRFTWVRFFRTKDEAHEAIIKFIKNIQVCLNAIVRNVRTDNGTEFVNQTLREFYENVGISHQTSVARTP